MLTETEARASIKSLEKVQQDAQKFYDYLLNNESNWDAETTVKRIEKDALNLLTEFDYINQRLIKEKLIEARIVPPIGSTRTRLNLILCRIPALLEILRCQLTPISPDQRDKLDRLKSEISEICKGYDTDYQDNLFKATEAFESGHWLGSILITGRVTSNLIELIPLSRQPNKEKNETVFDMRMQYLIDKGILPKGDRGATNQLFIRTEKIIRDLFSHRLEFKGGPDEAMSILGNTLQIMKFISEKKIAKK